MTDFELENTSLGRQRLDMLLGDTRFFVGENTYLHESLNNSLSAIP